jgi:glutamate mutase epsilon subunit
MTIKRELTALQKKITAIGQKMEKVLSEIENAQARVAKLSKPKAVKAKAVKASTKKAPAKKTAKKVTDTDKLLNIINRSKKGVDAAILMKKTGFNRKKVTNILQRTFKQGKVQRADKGIYVKAKKD